MAQQSSDGPGNTIISSKGFDGMIFVLFEILFVFIEQAGYGVHKVYSIVKS